MYKLIAPIASAGAFALTLLASTDARADQLEACGGVYFEALAEGSCEVVPTQDCTTRCEPVATHKVCASRLYHDCEGSCSLEATVECHAGCEEVCVPDCETAPVEQPPNCMGLCMSDCQMEATAQCDGVEDHGQCRSSGAHCCSEKCEAECAVQTETTCEPLCETACYGACDGRASLECQIDCQTQTFTECETTVVEECNQECMTTGAAIFCDGQFLATQGDLQACADELADHFSIQLDVDIDIDGDVDCDEGMCEGEGELDGDGTFSCGASVDPNGRTKTVAFGLLMLLVGGWRLRRAAR